MELTSTLQDIYGRFEKEANTILEQVVFIEESVILTSVREKNNTFTRSMIPSFKSIEDIHGRIDDMSGDILCNIGKLAKELEKMEKQDIPKRFLGIEFGSEEDELIQFICDIIDSGETNQEKIVNEVNLQLESMCIINGEEIDGDFYLNLYDNPEKLLEYINVSISLCHNKHIDELQENIDLLTHHMKLMKMIDIRNSLNIYRQAFIQLIAAFDTIVFECFKLKFANNFFKWLKLFEDSNIKYHDISNHGSFEVFQNETIEKKLKKCYLKDLLIVVRNLDKNIFTLKGRDCYINFREMINRRNCHIHNSGIVDKAYLGLDNLPQERFNIYQLEIGAYLQIDKKYLVESLENCTEFLNNLINI